MTYATPRPVITASRLQGMNANNGKTNLERYLILLEDTLCRLARDINNELMRLPEIKSSGLAKCYLHEISDIFDKRRRQIKRQRSQEWLNMYEDKIREAVNACTPHIKAAKLETRTALTQKVKYQSIERATLLGIMGGLTDSASTVHRKLYGFKGSDYAQIKDKLKAVEELLPCNLLNGGKLPDTAQASAAFAKMFAKLSESVIDTFSVKHNDKAQENE